MSQLLPRAELPADFDYPAEFLRVVDRGLVDLEPWLILQGEELLVRHHGLRTRYPERRVVPFASRIDRDDVACWDLDVDGVQVSVLGDFEVPGFEHGEVYPTFHPWFRAAVEDFITFDDPLGARDRRDDLRQHGPDAAPEGYGTPMDRHRQRPEGPITPGRQHDERREAVSEVTDHFCRVCGYRSDEPPWGDDGRLPSFEHCPCCGVEWGYQDSSLVGAERFQARWLAEGAPWRDKKVPPDGLTTEERLRRIGAERSTQVEERVLQRRDGAGEGNDDQLPAARAAPTSRDASSEASGFDAALHEPLEKEVSVTEVRPLALTQAEMLVLFDWLARSSERGSPINELHEAERRVFWDLEAALERTLTAPFSPHYGTLLETARREVLGRRTDDADADPAPAPDQRT